MAAIKIVGYLEKKGKSKVVTSWKKYWFVLEGRLLLYYTSKEEYLKISPCKGSINIGLVTAIRPGIANLGVFDIITRTSTITLRAKDGVVQNKWLQALLEATGQSVSSPVKMNHFRYSMDDLSPSNGKKSIVRQNTLPRNYKSNENGRNSIIHKIKSIGGIPTITPENSSKYISRSSKLENQNINKKICCENNNIVETKPSDIPDSDEIFENDAYQTINKLCEITEKNKDNNVHKIDKMNATNNLEDSNYDEDMILQNTLYATVDKNETTPNIKNQIKIRNSVTSEDDVFLQNDVYSTIDKNQNDDISNNGMCENTQYISHTSPLYQSVDNLDEPKIIEINNKPPKDDDTEYYCSYFENVQNRDKSSKENIYNELDPALPPRKQRHSSEVETRSNDSKEKGNKKGFMQLVKRCSDEVKKNNKAIKKKSKDFFTKVIRKKKNNKLEENLYDSVDQPEYAEPEYIKPETEIIKPKKIDLTNNHLVPTLTELQHKLEERKTHLKVEINKFSQPGTSTQIEVLENDSAHKQEKSTLEEIKDTIKSADQLDEPPLLPTRKGLRSHSPQDVSNQSPQISYSIDKILDDLKKLENKHNSKENTPIEELTVKQLIKRFDDVVKLKKKNPTGNDTEEVLLRNKNDSKDFEENKNIFINRHSDELNKLLEELTKVTCAPLMTPGATSSLVQMKSDGLTDEEWLALNPIRRRRHSEPDYDVPRPHRSLQILPRSPDKDEDKNDIAISATRFFGPVLPPEIEKVVDNTISCRSMTPDSLEPLHSYYNGIKSQRNSEINTTYTVEKHIEIHDDTIKSQDNSFDVCSPKNNCNNDTYIINKLDDYTEIKTKQNENFLDSLEPFIETSTVF